MKTQFDGVNGEKLPSSHRRIKVVVRHLPPGLPEDAFWMDIDRVGYPNSCLIASWFVPGHIPRRSISLVLGSTGRVSASLGKQPTPGRAYMVFQNQHDSINFASRYNGHAFVDAKGNTYPVKVEVAFWQRVPGQRKARSDPLMNTIHADKEFLEFSAQSAKKMSRNDSVPTSSGDNLESREIDTTIGIANEKNPEPACVLTPLLEYLHSKRKKRIRRRSRSPSKVKLDRPNNPIETKGKGKGSTTRLSGTSTAATKEIPRKDEKKSRKEKKAVKTSLQSNVPTEPSTDVSRRQSKAKKLKDTSGIPAFSVEMIQKRPPNASFSETSKAKEEVLPDENRKEAKQEQRNKKKTSATSDGIAAKGKQHPPTKISGAHLMKSENRSKPSSRKSSTIPEVESWTPDVLPKEGFARSSHLNLNANAFVPTLNLNAATFSPKLNVDAPAFQPRVSVKGSVQVPPNPSSSKPHRGRMISHKEKSSDSLHVPTSLAQVQGDAPGLKSHCSTSNRTSSPLNEVVNPISSKSKGTGGRGHFRNSKKNKCT
jgi:regulator of nonsense transcripts 3